MMQPSIRLNRIAVLYVLLQAIVLPAAFGEWQLLGWGFMLIQLVLIAVLMAIAAGSKLATWTLFVVLLLQLVAIESSRQQFFINAGYGVRVGLVIAPNLMDSGLGFNLFEHYFASLGIGRAPFVRCLTDGKKILGAVMLNVAVIPPLVLLWLGLIGRRPKLPAV